MFLMQPEKSFCLKNDDVNLSIPTQATTVKKESALTDEENHESIMKPVNCKVESTSDGFVASSPATDSPAAGNDPHKHDTSSSVSPKPPSISSGIKIYANLESAMPVAGISPQSPISIQTIEV